jgi:hypothetical protein
MARFFTTLAILNMLQIQNQQVYSFYVMVNILLFLVMGFTFLFVMSYMLGSPRPEKTMLGMLDRFFRSAEFLMSRTGPPRAGRRRALENRVPRASAEVDAGEARDVGRPPTAGTVPTRRPSRRPGHGCRPWSTASSSSDAGGAGRKFVRGVRDDLATWRRSRGFSAVGAPKPSLSPRSPRLGNGRLERGSWSSAGDAT